LVLCQHQFYPPFQNLHLLRLELQLLPPPFCQDLYHHQWRLLLQPEQHLLRYCLPHLMSLAL
jgi:hypothetical protein